MTWQWSVVIVTGLGVLGLTVLLVYRTLVGYQQTQREENRDLLQALLAMAGGDPTAVHHALANLKHVPPVPPDTPKVPDMPAIRTGVRITHGEVPR